MYRNFNLEIFILDDDESHLEIINKLLKENNFTNYKLFTDPETMLANIHKNVHICVIDYILHHNDLNGMDVIKQVITTNPYCYFILFSGFRSFDLALEFDHTTMRGHFIVKDGSGKDNILLIKFLRQFIDDIDMIVKTYLFMQHLEEQLNKVETIIKKLNPLQDGNLLNS